MKFNNIRHLNVFNLIQHLIALVLILVISIYIAIPSGLFSYSSEEFNLENFGNAFILKNEEGELEILKNKLHESNFTLDVIENNKVISKNYNVSFDNNHFSINGDVLALSTKSGNTYLSDDGKTFKKQKGRINSLNFAKDAISPPNISALLNGSAFDLVKTQHSSQISALVYSSGMREIEYYAVLPEDFSFDRTDDELLSEILRVTFNANQYLKDINLKLIPKGIKVYRSTSKYTQALKTRDPYLMLSNGVDERSQINKDKVGDLLVVFSRSYFSRATGLSFQNVICSNPTYSVSFVSGGASNNSFELSLSSVLAHEAGHIIGMGHDDTLYSQGFSLMATRQQIMPFGFSEKSKNEELAFSGLGQESGSCLSSVLSSTDSDKDGYLDNQEDAIGSDSLDNGSFYSGLSGKTYLGWNTFNQQELVGEFGGADLNSKELTVKLYNSEGNTIFNGSLSLKGFQEVDLIFSNILSNYKDQYGLIEISSEGNYYARGSTYAFKNKYDNLQYVNQQSAFSSFSKDPVFIPYNSIVPSGLTNISSVQNWLSLVNLGDKTETFRVRTFSPYGILSKEISIAVPAKGRRDIQADNDVVTDKSGIIQVEVLNSNNTTNFNSFINRYYLDRNSKFITSLLVEGQKPSGAKKIFVNNSQATANADAWIEVVNSLLVSNAVHVKVEKANNEVILDKMIEISPLSAQHINLPNLSQDYIVSLESLKTEGLSILGVSYSNKSGVSVLPFQEEFRVDRYSSVNTFLNTNNYLVVSNTLKKKGVLVCKLNENQSTNYNLTGNPFEIIKVKDLFSNLLNNNYSTITCRGVDGSGGTVPISMRVDRVLGNNLTIKSISK